MPRIDGRWSYIKGNSAVYKNSSLGSPPKRQKVTQVTLADITRDNSERLYRQYNALLNLQNVPWGLQ